jgi:hypothetical protein
MSGEQLLKYLPGAGWEAAFRGCGLHVSLVASGKNKRQVFLHMTGKNLKNNGIFDFFLLFIILCSNYTPFNSA